jgi:mRNA interferase MazF
MISCSPCPISNGIHLIKYQVTKVRNMKKDFDKWNEFQKSIDAKIEENRLFFAEGDIWWVHLGLNIGFESNGKDDEFIRPVIILKKHNKYTFLALPLTTASKTNKYKMSVGVVDGKKAFANLSQIRNLDSKRLINKVGHLESKLFLKIKEKTRQANLG